MSKLGWFSIRSIPATKQIDVSPYYRVLIRFFTIHRLCPECKGKGYSYGVEDRQINQETSVKVKGIEDLENIECDSITDVIREILEYQIWDKRSCERCNGFRFIRRKMKIKKAG